MTLSSERSVAPEKSEKFTIAVCAKTNLGKWGMRISIATGTKLIINPQVSVEEKLALLERKFGALEKKYVELTGGMSEREANAATDQASEEVC